MALMILGGALVGIGLLMLLFMRERDSSGGASVKYKEFELGSAKPSLFLIGVGVIVFVIPHVTGSHSEKQNGPSVPYVPGQPPSNDFGTMCCTDQGNCPLSLTGPGIKGTACLCMSALGTMATGAVCSPE